MMERKEIMGMRDNIIADIGHNLGGAGFSLNVYSNGRQYKAFKWQYQSVFEKEGEENYFVFFILPNK